MNAEPLAPGPSQRVQQLNSLVQQEVAGLLERQVEWPVGSLVTVTRVMVADDAESAKVWLSVLPPKFEAEVLTTVMAHIRDIQTRLNKKLIMKFVPKLSFFIDQAGEKTATINSVLDKIESGEEI